MTGDEGDGRESGGVSAGVRRGDRAGLKLTRPSSYGVTLRINALGFGGAGREAGRDGAV